MHQRSASEQLQQKGSRVKRNDIYLIRKKECLVAYCDFLRKWNSAEALVDSGTQSSYASTALIAPITASPVQRETR